MNGRIEEIHADEGQVGRGIFRLFHEVHHVAFFIDLSDAEPMWIWNSLQQDLCRGRSERAAGLFEGSDKSAEVLLQ
jgi:hypothetical protein